MEFTIYETKTRKVKGEDTDFLSLVAEISDFDSIEEALEALMDEVPEYIGVELTVFTQEPMTVTVNENPSKYAFSVNGGSVTTVDEEEANEEEEAEEEPVAAAPRSQQRRRKRTTASPAKTNARSASSKKASPFRSNPKSAE